MTTGAQGAEGAIGVPVADGVWPVGARRRQNSGAKVIELWRIWLRGPDRRFADRGKAIVMLLAARIKGVSRRAVREHHSHGGPGEKAIIVDCYDQFFR